MREHERRNREERMNKRATEQENKKKKQKFCSYIMIASTGQKIHPTHSNQKYLVLEYLTETLSNCYHAHVN